MLGKHRVKLGWVSGCSVVRRSLARPGAEEPGFSFENKHAKSVIIFLVATMGQVLGLSVFLLGPIPIFPMLLCFVFFSPCPLFTLVFPTM